jgi:hypothetical protein
VIHEAGKVSDLIATFASTNQRQGKQTNKKLVVNWSKIDKRLEKELF